MPVFRRIAFFYELLSEYLIPSSTDRHACDWFVILLCVGQLSFVSNRNKDARNSLMISSVTDPTVLKKYPSAHKCYPQYCLLSSWNSSCSIFDECPFRAIAGSCSAPVSADRTATNESDLSYTSSHDLMFSFRILAGSVSSVSPLPCLVAPYTYTYTYTLLSTPHNIGYRIRYDFHTWYSSLLHHLPLSYFQTLKCLKVLKETIG